MPKTTEIEIRSDEVQEILSYVPNWMIRWGITLIFGIIVLLVFISWFIKYPDVVSGEIVLTTKIPPSKIVTLSSGNVQKIFLQDRSKVQKGDKIAEIETGINPKNIDFLKQMLVSVDSFIKSPSTNNLINLDTNIVFGGMQADYSQLTAAVKNYDQMINDAYYPANIGSLEKQIEEYHRLAFISKRELKIGKAELANATLKYKTDQELYQSKVLAKLQFKAEESKYLLAQKSLEQGKKSLVQTNITIVQLEKQLNELVFTTQEKKRGFLTIIQSSSRNLKNAINTWKHTQVLSAPIDGELSYLKNISENQFLKQGEEIFAIIPSGENYIGFINLPVRGAGKVKEQQVVRIKLNNYPYHEYGQIDGIVEQISQVANNKFYRVKISLPNKLLSSYGKQLNFSPEMSGTAEIITEDLRLMERVFNNFRKLFR